MKISKRAWLEYVEKLASINERASELVKNYIAENGVENRQELLDYVYAVVTKYGEASGALACKMHEAIAEAQNIVIPAAEPAQIPKYGEVAKAINGTIKQSVEKVPVTASRLVKQVGADTTLKNAERDGAQFAWIPHGNETCAFCIALASRGWQFMSKKALRNGHAEHIHGNCRCEYAIRFDNTSTVEGYDPDKYLEMYENADPEGNPDDKIKALRRQLGEQKKEKQRKTVVKIRDFDIIPDIKVKNLLKSREGLNAMKEVFDSYSALPKIVKEEMKDVTFHVGASSNSCDYIKGIIYVHKDAEKYMVDHEFGHMIEYRMIPKDILDEYKRYLLENIKQTDVKKEIYLDADGNESEVIIVHGDRFVSEYQGRIYVPSTKEAFDKDGNIRLDRMLEIISEPFRMYQNEPNELRKHNKIMSIFEEVFKE